MKFDKSELDGMMLGHMLGALFVEIVLELARPGQQGLMASFRGVAMGCMLYGFTKRLTGFI